MAARGLDIPSIHHVLHYQTPRTSESYVHRSGRTARASQDGLTVLLIEPTELPSYIKLCRTLGKSNFMFFRVSRAPECFYFTAEDIPPFPVQNDVLKTIKEIVNTARSLDKLELQYKKAKSESGWLQKAAEEMDIIIEDRYSFFCKYTYNTSQFLNAVSSMLKYDTSDAQKIKKTADLKRKQLADLLAKPLFPKGFSGKYPLQVEQSTLAIKTDAKMIQEEKAIDVMKTAMEEYAKKKIKPIFKKRKPARNGVVKTTPMTQKNNKKRNKK